jgi:N-acetylglucosamine-6-phosphate deacetylase
MTLVDEATLVLPHGEVDGAGLVVEDGVIVEVLSAGAPRPPAAERLAYPGYRILPGFIDVHVHGVDGIDVLDTADAVSRVAARLPRFGVTAFCPTTVACAPEDLAKVLRGVAAARACPPGAGARVLRAHLESNFINPVYRGAQPAECLRRPHGESEARGGASSFSGGDVLRVIAGHRDAVAIVTLAPEIEGGVDLVRTLTAAGHRVSLGHSAATYDEAMAAIEAGACHATHLFNRMPPLAHRAPGLAGAVLASPRVTAEIICDGYHVHPAMVRLAIDAKQPGGILAITDGTAASGLPVGARAQLGGRRIVASERTAVLEDGTLAGSVLTMDGALRMLVNEVGLSVVDAAQMCATAPADALGLLSQGRLTPGAAADLVVLDDRLRVRQTFVAGRPCLEH